MNTRPLDRRDFEEAFPLSAVQQGMVYLSAQRPEKRLYHNQLIIRLFDRAFDAAAFEQTLLVLCRRHGMLRTGFLKNRRGDYLQVVRREARPEYSHRDLSDFEEREQEDEIRLFLEQDLSRPFDLAGGGLLWRARTFDLGDGDVCLLWLCHHAMIDGWSGAALVAELTNVYSRVKEDPLFELPPLRSSYKLYVAEQTALRGDPEALAFWRRELDSYRRFSFPEPARSSDGGARRKKFTLELGGELRRRLAEGAGTSGLSPKSACFASYMTALAMFSYHNDITAGLVTHNRPVCADGERIIGCFLNTTPVRFLAPWGISWLESARAADETLLRIKAFDMIPLADIALALGETGRERNPICDVIFNFVDFFVYDQADDGLLRSSARRLAVRGAGDTNTLLDVTVESTGRRFELVTAYDPQFVDRETVAAFGLYFEAALRAIVERPYETSRKETLLDPAEKRRMLVSFNRTATPFPGHKTIPQLLEELVLRRPDRLALGGLPTMLSYRELWSRALGLAGVLKRRGLSPGGIVAVLADRSVELTVGIVAVLCAGGAYLPLDPANPPQRRSYMIRDSGASLLLTHEPYTRELEGELRCVDLCARGPGIELAAEKDPLAYAIYTSGTTGRPKGTLVEHKSVIRLVKEVAYVDIRPDDRMLQTANVAFDGSVFDIFGALLNGAYLYVSAAGGKMSISELGRLIRREATTLFFITTAMFNALVDFDLHSLEHVRHVLFGGEKASPSHCRIGLEVLGPGRLINVYGPTETAVYATSFTLESQAVAGKQVPIGKPISNTTAFVLDALAQPVPIGVAGELYIGGPGVARGYVNRPELTAEKFLACGVCGEDRLYRSGDLVRWSPSGILEYLGRIDTQVKIRGFRVETAEIEWALTNLPPVREAVVAPLRDHEGIVFLCAYFTYDGEVPSPEELKRELAQQMPEYMIPARFMPLDHFPLNDNGKVDRRALPQPAAPGRKDVHPPRDALERALLEIFAETLGLAGDNIGIDGDFFDLGGHSLTATRLAASIERDLEVELRLAEVFEHPTIAGLAELLRGRTQAPTTVLPAAEKREYYPLSGAQKRLYLLQCLQPEATAYNVPSVIPFEDGVDERMLERALNMAAARHGALRTWFRLVGDEPVQVVCPEIRIALQKIVLRGGTFPYHEVFASRARPFDLGEPPLWRACLCEMEHGACYLFWDIHHIITDGVSQGILRREIALSLRDVELPVPLIGYVDYALWQERARRGEAMRLQEEFWRGVYEGLPPVLELPADFPRPPVSEYQGATAGFRLAEEEAALLRRMARQSGGTVFMTVLAVFQVVLAKLSRQEDIVVGVPAAGRRQAELQGIVGMFVNMLPLRFKPERRSLWREFLATVTSGALVAFENQDLQFDELVELLDIPRDTGRNPLFDVVLNVLESGAHGVAFNLKPGTHRPGIAKFDLSLFVVDEGEELSLGFEYRSRLFRARSIDALAGYFRNVIRQAAAEPELQLQEIELMGPEERDLVLRRFNRTEKELPGRLSMAWELYLQAQVRPDRAALSGGGVQLSYEELNRRALRLAAVLRRHGTKPDSIVAVHMERSPAMVIAILAVIAAGGAYLALAPENPRERTRFILRDSGARLSLKVGCEEKKDGDALVLDVEDTRIYEGSTPCSPPVAHGPGDLFYVLYTSGSTGTPKGVLVENRGVFNVMRYLERVFPMGGHGVFLFKTNCMFDVSVSELFGWIMGAGKIAILPQGDERDPGLIARAVGRERVTHIDFVPSMLKVFLDCLEEEDMARLRSLAYVLAGGEEFTRDLAGAVLRSGLDATVANFCGPTETTIYATAYILPPEPETGPVPIGAPVDNVFHYIVEPDGGCSLVPPLSAGELLIGGVGVGRGYLNRPDMTHGRFCDDPFVAGGRAYRSGDLCRWRWSGDVDYLGRMDHQVKIRGFRVELGEIENRLAGHPSIQAAAVTVVERGGKDPAIAAYYVPAAGETPDQRQLKDFIVEMLPAYMAPSYFTALESLPRTGSGKIARRLLPPPIVDAGIERVDVPTDPLELALRRLWSAVLAIGEEVIGRDSDFFSIGGHSLTAAALVSRLKRDLGLDVALLDVFSHPTIRGLAGCVNRRNAPDILLVHDGTGGVEGYAELARAVDSGIVCRGVPAPVAEFDCQTLEIEALARLYVRRHSPISEKTVIAGWSLGATIAFEMARQLEAAGNGAAAVVLIDGLPPDQALESGIGQAPAGGEIQVLLERFPVLRQPAYAGLSAEELRGLAGRMHAFAAARSRYTPHTKLGTPVVCVCAGDGRFIRHRLWSRHVKGHVQFFDIEGDHFSLLRPPGVEELAALLERLQKNQNI